MIMIIMEVGMKKEKSCGAVIYKYFNNELYILVLKHNKGHWSFSKGHMEDYESEEETALREVKEETNLDIILNTNYRYCISYSPREGVIKDVVFFLGKPKNDEIKAQITEIMDIRWLKYQEAYDILTYNGDKEILNKAIKDIKSLSN